MEFLKENDRYYLRLARGEKLMSSLIEFARKENIQFAELSGLGAVQQAEIGFFEVDKKDYKKDLFEDSMELVSAIGNISFLEGQPFPHVHVALGLPNHQLIGGHLF